MSAIDNISKNSFLEPCAFSHTSTVWCSLLFKQWLQMHTDPYLHWECGHLMTSTRSSNELGDQSSLRGQIFLCLGLYAAYRFTIYSNSPSVSLSDFPNRSQRQLASLWQKCCYNTWIYFASSVKRWFWNHAPKKCEDKENSTVPRHENITPSRWKDLPSNVSLRHSNFHSFNLSLTKTSISISSCEQILFSNQKITWVVGYRNESSSPTCVQRDGRRRKRRRSKQTWPSTRGARRGSHGLLDTQHGHAS